MAGTIAAEPQGPSGTPHQITADAAQLAFKREDRRYPLEAAPNLSGLAAITWMGLRQALRCLRALSSHERLCQAERTRSTASSEANSGDARDSTARNGPLIHPGPGATCRSILALPVCVHGFHHCPWGAISPPRPARSIGAAPLFDRLLHLLGARA